MDKERTKEFNRKLKDLQGVVDEKNQQLNDYQDIEKIADEKIRALNAIHAEKIRALMNSIQLLKKENASMGKQSKEHKRSELIQQLNKEIADQDTVIEVLRGLVNNNQKADAAIIATLTKGPARVRVLTREELKIEIKDLKAKLLKYEKKKPGTATEDEKMAEMDMQNMSAISVKQTGTKLGAGNAEFIIKINELNNQIEDLNLLVSGKQTENDKYRQLISHKNQEIIELTQAKIDLKFMTTKNDELKNEIESLKQKLYSDLYNNYDQEIKLGELELANTVHKNLQNKTNEAIKLEMETLQIRIAELAGQNKQLVSSNTKLKDENLNVRAQLEEAKERNRTIRAGHEEQLEKINQNLKVKEDDIKSLKSKLVELENTFDGLKIDARDKDSIIADLQSKLRAMEEEAPRGSHRSAGSAGSGQKAAAFNEELEHRNLELEQEVNHLCQENHRLKERAKDLIKNEIELSDRIDVLEQENKLLNRKVIAANLISKDSYKDTVTLEQMHAHLREAANRYEKRIKELMKQVQELEARNTELEDVQRIMNNQSMTSVTSSRLNTDA